MGRLAFGHYDRAVFSPLAFRSAQDVGGACRMDYRNGGTGCLGR